ncbi:hypothetical protein LTR66_007979 [Elasticomyces elasticus]|nr:hypothetical protein LTR66_007979 [Elasticomyces elasticus]
MVGRLAKSVEGQRLWVNGRWQPQAVRQYIRRVNSFLELLLFLVHTTGGQPATCTEIMTARHQNGFLQDCNVFATDGQVVFVSRYHKTQSLWDKPRVVPRVLPWRVGQLVRIFLAVIVQESAVRLGCRLTTLDYRHAVIAIGRQVVGEQFGHGYQEQVGEEDIGEPEMELDSGLELQAGRTEKIGVQTYGVPIDIVQHLSLRSVKFFRQLSEGWHSFIDLCSSWEQEKARQDKKDRLLVTCWKEAGSESAKRLSEAGTTSPKKRARMDGGRTDVTSFAAAHRYSAKRTEVTAAEIEQAMQKALGQSGISFRSKEQSVAMKAILAGETPLIIVLPTGGGKTLLFTAPACLEDPGVTVVVVPFRALINDLKDRLKKARIEHLEWRNGEVNSAAVVIVSADFAGSWGFLTYASLLDQKGLLRRVVVDECYLTYTASDYRPKLVQLKNLRTLSCQMVLLTATQPPMLENELEESVLVRGARHIRRVRCGVTSGTWCSNASGASLLRRRYRYAGSGSAGYGGKKGWYSRHWPRWPSHYLRRGSFRCSCTGCEYDFHAFRGRPNYL